MDVLTSFGEHIAAGAPIEQLPADANNLTHASGRDPVSGMRMNDSDDPPKVPMVVQVVPYDPGRGLISDWDDDTVLRIEVLESPPKTILISGNPAGLTSLARHLLTLAQPGAPTESHLDFDDYCGWFEEGSYGVRIESRRAE